MRNRIYLKTLSQRLKQTSALVGVLSSLCCFAGSAAANPQGGQVVGGQATISTTDPNTLTVNQFSSKAIIDWHSFNIDAGETTRFLQPNSSSVILNRVVGSQDPSRIMGTLHANGTVMLVNPDGILFGPNSQVDVGGLVATTSDISNSDFMAGNFNFSIPGKPSASIVNQGNITIKDHGIGAFVAPGVRNQGVISARLGKVSLASANQFTLDLFGDGLVNLAIGDEITQDVIDVATGLTVADLVKNEGRITADGGIVALSAATARTAVNSVINNTGIIEARSVAERNGKIILGGQTADTKAVDAPKQIVRVSGKLDVSGKNKDEKGGLVLITGEVLTIADLGIDASGYAGGGRVLIGGDYLGGKGDHETIAKHRIPIESFKVPTALEVALLHSVSINADALYEGDGGKIIVWSDNATATEATLTARGGKLGGDGGFIETSGKQRLASLGIVDVSSANGISGTWLLDPANVTIDSGGTNIVGGFFDPGNTNSIITASSIEAALNTGTNVTIQTGPSNVPGFGDITVRTSINKTAGGDATLSLLAHSGILIPGGSPTIPTAITSTSGKLNIILNGNIDPTSGGNVGLPGIPEFNPAIVTNGGSLEISALDFLPDRSGIRTNGGDVVINLTNGASFPEILSGPPGNPRPPDFFVIDAGAGSVTIRRANPPAGPGTINLEDYSIFALGGVTIDLVGGAPPTEISVGLGSLQNSTPEIVYSGSLNITNQPSFLETLFVQTRSEATRAIDDALREATSQADTSSEIRIEREFRQVERHQRESKNSKFTLEKEFQKLLEDSFGIPQSAATVLVSDALSSIASHLSNGGYLSVDIKNILAFAVSKEGRHITRKVVERRYSSESFVNSAAGSAAFTLAADLFEAILEPRIHTVEGKVALRMGVRSFKVLYASRNFGLIGASAQAIQILAADLVEMHKAINDFEEAGGKDLLSEQEQQVLDAMINYAKRLARGGLTKRQEFLIREFLEISGPEIIARLQTAKNSFGVRFASYYPF